MESGRAHTVEVGYDEFCGALAARDLKPLWKIAKQLMPEVPLPTTQPWLWRWEEILPLARRAGEIITLERGGDRRVLAFANPGLHGLPFTSTTLWGRHPVSRSSRIGARASPHAFGHPFCDDGVRRVHHGERRRLPDGAG
jgi:gentisate 1,2-dioxygenase